MAENTNSTRLTVAMSTRSGQGIAYRKNGTRMLAGGRRCFGNCTQGNRSAASS
jgi:hypothetical protein